MKTKDHLQVYTGSAHPRLAADIARYLDVPLGDLSAGRFPDGEINVKVNHDVRGADVYLVQPTCPPVNENLMELLIMIDCMRRASAERITAVVPYFGYARKDRKDEGRVPITAKLVADLVTTAGATRVLTMDLHAGQIQGFFNIPVDNLFSAPVLLPYLRSRVGRERVSVVSPDAGGVERARAFAKRLGASLAIIDKRRARDTEERISGKANLDVAEMRIIGEVEGRVAIIIDDMVDTAGTLTTAAAAVHEAGAQTLLACCTHPVLSGPAVERIRGSVLEEMVVTNSIPLGPEAQALDKIRVLSIAPLMGEAIRRIHNRESISVLFSNA